MPAIQGAVTDDDTRAPQIICREIRIVPSRALGSDARRGQILTHYENLKNDVLKLRRLFRPEMLSALDLSHAPPQRLVRISELDVDRTDSEHRRDHGLLDARRHAVIVERACGPLDETAGRNRHCHFGREVAAAVHGNMQG